MTETTFIDSIAWYQYLAAFLAALSAGVVNSMAGGGTLLTFPTLLALGLGSRMANATSTLGLWPGSLGGAWGYRRELAEGGRELLWFFIPSLLGGTLGAVLLLLTEDRHFDDLVPWLILAATVLFILQGPIGRRLRARQKARADGGAGHTASFRRRAFVFGFQFLVGVYGGYFGAGIGILMLAALGLLGLTDIHQMNGVKNAAALFINGVAVMLFAFNGLVHWPMAGVMAVGALAGGYASAGLARWLGPRSVRWVVVAVGLVAAAGTAWTRFRASA